MKDRGRVEQRGEREQKGGGERQEQEWKGLFLTSVKTDRRTKSNWTGKRSFSLSRGTKGKMEGVKESGEKILSSYIFYLEK